MEHVRSKLSRNDEADISVSQTHNRKKKLAKGPNFRDGSGASRGSGFNLWGKLLLINFSLYTHKSKYHIQRYINTTFDQYSDCLDEETYSNIWISILQKFCSRRIWLQKVVDANLFSWAIFFSHSGDDLSAILDSVPLEAIDQYGQNFHEEKSLDLHGLFCLSFHEFYCSSRT